MVIDHLGLSSRWRRWLPSSRGTSCRSPALAAHKNVVVKITGACTLSHETFPYRISGIRLAASSIPFGLERLYWHRLTCAVALFTYKGGRRPVPCHRSFVR